MQDSLKSTFSVLDTSDSWPGVADSAATPWKPFSSEENIVLASSNRFAS